MKPTDQMSRPSRPSRHAPTVARLLAGAVLVVSACGITPLPLKSPIVTARPTTTGEPLLTEASESRQQLGLRADETYVRNLWRDPAAVELGQTSGYGFPITKAELDLVESRARSTKAVTDTIDRYASSHEDVWAGRYVDTTTGSVIARFTDDLAIHRSALARLLHPDARYELRAAEWTKVELEALRVEVRNNKSWFASVDAKLTGLGVDLIANRTIVDVRSNRADIVGLTTEHFRAANRITVRVSPGAWTGGRGDLVVVARDRTGNPVVNLDCVLEVDEPGAWGNEVRVTGDDGLCRFRRVGATGVTVILRGLVANEVLEFGRGRAMVVAGGTVTLIIRVDRTDRLD